jgi:hypothetical protein
MRSSDASGQAGLYEHRCKKCEGVIDGTADHHVIDPMQFRDLSAVTLGRIDHTGGARPPAPK